MHLSNDTQMEALKTQVNDSGKVSLEHWEEINIPSRLRSSSSFI